MIGGVTLRGADIYQQAQDEIEKLEENIRTTYEEFLTYDNGVSYGSQSLLSGGQGIGAVM